MIENLCYKTVICFFLLIILVVQAPVFAGVISTKDDLKKFVIIGVHPFNWMDNNKGQWNHIFSKYNIQFLDRNTSLNDVDFRIELDSWHVAFANENHIPDASYFSFHPQDMDRDDWSFELRYYSSLPQSEKWIDLNGQVITDPFEGGAARDVNGNIIRWSDTFVLMSQNNFLGVFT